MNTPHGSPPWWAGEPVAFLRALRSPAGDTRLYAARVGAVPCATLRGAERDRPAPWGPPVSKGPTSEVDGPWPHSRFLVLGCADGADSPLSQSQMIGQLGGQPAFQGPLFEQSGEQAISPSDHRPLPESIRSNKPSNAPQERNCSTTSRPPTRATTPSVTTYQSFQIKGDTQTNEHAHGPRAALTRSGCKTGTAHVTHAARSRPPSRRAVSDAAVRDAPAPATATATWVNWHQAHPPPTKPTTTTSHPRPPNTATITTTPPPRPPPPNKT